MSHQNYYDFTLRLRSINDLFQAPEFDPFAGQTYSISGIDQLINELKPKSLGRRVRTTIQLPTKQLSQDLTALTQAAVKRYCEARIYQITQELTSLRWQGIKALQAGLIFLALCLLLSTLFDGLEGLPELLRQFLGEGLLIVGWVSLWHPTELLLYEWWPHRRDKQLHERLRDMEITIEAHR